jgi:NADH-quinone oxidoreductase subunit J
MINLYDPQSVLFVLFSGLAILSALILVLHKNPVVSAVFLVLGFFALAGIYAIMNAVFIATMQILVYAGAIMVLVVFVIMLLSLREETLAQIWDKPIKKAFIIGVVFVYSFFLLTTLLLGRSDTLTTVNQSGNFRMTGGQYEYILNAEKSVSAIGNTATVGASTFIDYLLPFELISILLLAAVVGAVVLAKKDVQPKEGSK